MPDKSRKPDGGGLDGPALWQRVTETVRPLKGRAVKLKPPRAPVRPEPVEAPSAGLQGRRKGRAAGPASAAATPVAFNANGSGAARKTVTPPQPTPNTLDGGWDKRLARGVVAPDMTIDLHGYTLSAAHDQLEAELGRAIARHARLILLVTGRPPPPGRSRLDNPMRGVIRASIGDWLHHSRHAGQIAAVRNAHPRHGGAGALYVVLRRVRA